MRSVQTIFASSQLGLDLAGRMVTAAMGTAPQLQRCDRGATARCNGSSRGRQLSSTAEAVPSNAAWQDRIHLRGLRFYAFHGALPEENVIGQPFTVDATVFCNTKPAGLTDDLSKTINYAEVHRVIHAIMTGPPKQLLECLAESICKDMLQQLPRVEGVQVHVRKLCIPAVVATLDSVGVEVSRCRADYIE